MAWKLGESCIETDPYFISRFTEAGSSSSSGPNQLAVAEVPLDFENSSNCSLHDHLFLYVTYN